MATDLKIDGDVLKAGNASANTGVTLAFTAPTSRMHDRRWDWLCVCRRPIEFIRNPAGVVRWIRVNGRIAKKV